MSDPPPSAERAAVQSADAYLAPVLFGLAARVRAEAERVAGQGARNGGASAPDPEAIHDFRVALRRLRTVLRPARRVFGRHHLAAVGDELRRYAQVTGALRDEEVLRETLSGLELPERARVEVRAWLVLRARQERARRRSVGAVVGAKDATGAAGATLGDALAHLERRLGRRSRRGHAAMTIAKAAVEDAARDVAERVHAPTSDPRAMHELRIRYKRLRYTAELFAPLLGEPAAAVAKEAARMQKHLGELHDLDEALVRVRRARSLTEATRGTVRRALGRARAERSRRIADELAHARHAIRERASR